MFIPIRSKNPPESLPVVTILLMSLNVIGFACTSNGLVAKPTAIEQWAQNGPTFSIQHALFSMFMHATLGTLVVNLWFLYLVGFSVEGRLRWWKYVVVYFGSGLGTAAVYEWALHASYVSHPYLGASGALFGVLGASLYMFPYAQYEFYIMYKYSSELKSFAAWSICPTCMLFGLAALACSTWIKHPDFGPVVTYSSLISGTVLCALMFPKRDSVTASDTKAGYSDTHDLSRASRFELSEMYRSQPDDPYVVLSWMYRSLTDHQVDPQCKDAFFRLLPQILAKEPPASVGSCLLGLNSPAGSVPVHALLSTASACEHVNEAQIALNLYRDAAACPSIGPDDREMALFRSGMIYERSFQDFSHAIACYEQVVKLYDMSSLADQARLRISALRAVN